MDERRGLRGDGSHQPAVALGLLGHHGRHPLMGGGDRPARHFRAHRARFDHDHLDAERGDFASQGVTDRFERELRVMAISWISGDAVMTALLSSRARSEELRPLLEPAARRPASDFGCPVNFRRLVPTTISQPACASGRGGFASKPRREGSGSETTRPILYAKECVPNEAWGFVRLRAEAEPSRGVSYAKIRGLGFVWRFVRVRARALDSRGDPYGSGQA